MDDPTHLEKFNHDCSRDLQVDVTNSSRMRSQGFDYFLVLDLEGKIEILEFPVVMIDAKNMNIIDFFHRFSSLLPSFLLLTAGVCVLNVEMFSLCFLYSIPQS